MRYLKTFRTVSQAAEEGFLHGIKRTCYDTFYPFQIFGMIMSAAARRNITVHRRKTGASSRVTMSLTICWISGA